MSDQEPILQEGRSKRSTYAIRGIPILLLVWFLILFRTEIGEVLSFLWGIVQVFLGKPFGTVPPTLLRSFIVLVFNLVIGFGLVFIAWLLIASAQAILPVRNWGDVQKTAEHLLYYIQGMHGPAVFIKDGKVQSTPGELKRRGPGVIVVDYNSAVVLEQLVGAPSLTAYLRRPDRQPKPRALGAGIHFTMPSQRIRGVVDLRRQMRTHESGLPSGTDRGVKISAYTRDGIEITAKISTLFTVGETADVIQLAYDGDIRAENLKIITLEKLANGLLKIKFTNEEIDEDDRREIHHYARVANRLDGLEPCKDLPKSPEMPVFDESRIFATVFSQARTADDEVIPWVGLPPRVAVDLFRKELSQVNYDDLYLLTPSKHLKLREYQARLKARMRNSGVLSFRMVFHQSGQQLQKDLEYDPAELLASPVKPLTTPKVLRERGIKIINSSFSDLTPVDEAVYKRRLDNWRVKWEQDTEMIDVNADLEAMRVRTRARLQAQQEITRYLAQLLQETEISQEVLAVRVFQALESAASDPKTRQLLPADTISIMRNVRDCLLPGESGANFPRLPQP